MKEAANRFDYSAERPREKIQAILVQPVHSWLSDTTAHGLGRLVGVRPIYVKVVWFVGFAFCLAGFVTQVQVFINTYREQPETTTLKQNSLEFEFPDLIICNKAIMSASYPYILDPISTAAVNSYVTQFTALFGVPANQIQAAGLAISLLATMPYRIISESLGNRKLQFLFLTTINGWQMNSIPISQFYSPLELNCIRLEPTDQHRQILSTEGSYLEVGLFLDSAFFDFPKTASLLPIPVANASGINFLAWDFENGINLEGASGVNLYFARPGHYPDTDSMIQLSSGKDYRIDLEIERLILSKGMQCSSNNEPSRIVSPYDGTEVAYKYSEFLCRADRSNELLMQQSGCVSHLLPRNRKFVNVSNCLNVSRVSSGQVTMAQFVSDLNNGAYSSRNLDQKAIQQYCTDRRPCETDSFKYSYSFSNWPRIFSSFQRDILERFQLLVQTKKLLYPSYSFPGYDDMINIANAMLKNLTTHNIVISASYLQDQVMRLRIFADKSLGSAIQIEKSYDLTNLVADTGGLLGLYLGCSLLTMLEAVELLHDCLIACFSTAASVLELRKSNSKVKLAVVENKTADCSDDSTEQQHQRKNDSLSSLSVTDLGV